MDEHSWYLHSRIYVTTLLVAWSLTLTHILILMRELVVLFINAQYAVKIAVKSISVS